MGRYDAPYPSEEPKHRELEVFRVQDTEGVEHLVAASCWTDVTRIAIANWVVGSISRAGYFITVEVK
jgi:hypothetical protein